MKEALVNNSAQSIHVDETTVQVLGVDEREKSYMYVSTTSFWNRPILIYDFSLDRTTTEFEVMIENYDGFITVDGYGGYDKFKENGEKPLKGVQMCWAHLRRYWVNADPEMLSKKRKRNKETEAEKMVHLIDKVFQKEKQFKNRKLTMDEIKAERKPSYRVEEISESRAPPITPIFLCPFSTRNSADVNDAFILSILTLERYSLPRDDA